MQAQLFPLLRSVLLLRQGSLEGSRKQSHEYLMMAGSSGEEGREKASSILWKQLGM